MGNRMFSTDLVLKGNNLVYGLVPAGTSWRNMSHMKSLALLLLSPTVGCTLHALAKSIYQVSIIIIDVQSTENMYIRLSRTV